MINDILNIRAESDTFQLFDGRTVIIKHKLETNKEAAIQQFMQLPTEQFILNLYSFVAAGSWKDVVQMMIIDHINNGWKHLKLPWKFLGESLLLALADPTQHELVKQHIPKERTKKRRKTDEAVAKSTIASWLCYLLYGNNKETRRNFYFFRNTKQTGNHNSWLKLLQKNQSFSCYELQTLPYHHIKDVNSIQFQGYPFEAISNSKNKTELQAQIEAIKLKQTSNCVDTHCLVLADDRFKNLTVSQQTVNGKQLNYSVVAEAYIKLNSPHLEHCYHNRYFSLSNCQLVELQDRLTPQLENELYHSRVLNCLKQLDREHNLPKQLLIVSSSDLTQLVSLLNQQLSCTTVQFSPQMCPHNLVI